ncbi:MAG: glutamine-hydrolyzing GMP synthase [Magnetococcales bacterium]|nr:glutamine-hydrolyzing GMP synthase [Magnetococcales bacterium]
MTNRIHAERILILDFGSQYTQLIARRVREAHTYCEIHPFNMTVEEIRGFKPKGIILSGGHQSVYDENSRIMDPVVFELGVPILGICYGMHLLTRHFGGEVEASATREYGHAKIQKKANASYMFDALLPCSDAGNVWMSHGDHVTTPPDGFDIVAESQNGIVAGLEDVSRGFFAVQFHPEVNHTQNGDAFLDAFIKRACGCAGLWTSAGFVEYEIAHAKQQVGDDQVLLGLSGGVDSSVVAALLHRAIGDKLTCVFVDNGLLRLNEGDEVMATFAKHMGVKVIRVDAQDMFLSRLKGVSDPEEKRKIIGHTFIEVFESEAKKITGVRWLAQGTIYPDVIESAGAKSGMATNIKSHHNVGGLPERMGLKLLEPLRELFKDEVRNVGLELGLPQRMVFRHPFPGPGLGVRILGEVKKEYADLLRRADAIYMDELYSSGHYEKTAQAFTVFLPVKSVGVMGDGRSYDYVVALRAVETKDYMTATAYPMPHDMLSKIANRIINEVKGINRVTYDITSKPPGTIEWE